MAFLNDTNIVVLISFLIFVGVLLYFKVPALVGGILDQRADKIRADIDEARKLREEAQTLLASYERKQKEVEAQAAKIVSSARDEAQAAGEQAREDLKASVARRVQAAEDQIASAEQAAVAQVRDQAISVAVAAARGIIADKLSAAEAGKLIDASIADVGEKLH